MAENEEKDKKAKKSKKKGKRPPIFLKLGKYFLLLLILSGQGFLAYAVVDHYYPSIYKKMNAKSPDDFGSYQFEELVVNPAQTNGKRYLLVEISVELIDKEHIPKLEEHAMKLKQEMIEALSKRTIPELVRVEGREEMRLELIDIINSVIEVRSVRNLYFTKYVMQ